MLETMEKNYIPLQIERLISNGKALYALAGMEPDADDLLQLVMDAPGNVKERDSVEWRSKSYCWKLLFQINEQSVSGAFNKEQQKVFDDLVIYWMEEFVALPDKVRGRILTLFYAMLSMEQKCPFLLLTVPNSAPEQDNNPPGNLLDFPIQMSDPDALVSDGQLLCETRMLLVRKLNAWGAGEYELTPEDKQDILRMNRIFDSYGYQTIDVDFSHL